MDLKSINITTSALVTVQQMSTPIAPKVPEEIDGLSKKSYLSINKPQTGMGFILDEDLSHRMITVIKDKKTGETLKFIPPEEQLKIKKHMADSVGKLLDVIG